MAKLSYAQVSALLKYDSETGKLFWRERPIGMCPSEGHWKMWNKQHAGKEAFTGIGAAGYYHGSILNIDLSAHRVAWLLHYKEWPFGTVDHRDGDRTNNIITNLRDVSLAVNLKNQKMKSSNTSGVNGVGWDKQTNKWRARVKVSSKLICLGRFSSFDEAVAAKEAAYSKYGFTDRHGH